MTMLIASSEKAKSTGRTAHAAKNLIRGLGRGFGAGLQEFFYSLDVGGNVYAYGVVHGFYYVHVEAVFQPAQLLELFDAF